MKLNVLVGEVMKKDVKKVNIEDNVEKAAKMMKKYHIGSVVVMGEKNVKGIVTTEDIVYRYVAGKRGNKVSDVMTRDLITISPNRTIEEAARLMADKKVKKLLVFEKERLVGIITSTDILNIEPALYEILLERIKIRRPGIRAPSAGAQFMQCEVCGNYSDDIKEMDGVWICDECEGMR